MRANYDNAEGHFLVVLGVSVSLSNAQRFRPHPFCLETEREIFTGAQLIIPAGPK